MAIQWLNKLCPDCRENYHMTETGCPKRTPAKPVKRVKESTTKETTQGVLI